MRRGFEVFILVIILLFISMSVIACAMPEDAYTNESGNRLNQGARFIRHDTNVSWVEIWEHEGTGVCYLYHDDTFIPMLKSDGTPYTWRD